MDCITTLIGKTRKHLKLIVLWIIIQNAQYKLCKITYHITAHFRESICAIYVRRIHVVLKSKCETKKELSLQNSHSSVSYFCYKCYHGLVYFKCIPQHILKKICTDVIYAISHLQNRFIWIATKRCTLKKNHGSALYVKKHMQEKILWITTLKYIQVKSLTSASYVTKNLLGKNISLCTSENTVKRDHSSAIFVAKHLNMWGVLW